MIPRCNMSVTTVTADARRTLFPVSLFLVHMAAARKFKAAAGPLHQPDQALQTLLKGPGGRPRELRVKRHEDIMYSYDHQKNHH